MGQDQADAGDGPQQTHDFIDLEVVLHPRFHLHKQGGETIQKFQITQQHRAQRGRQGQPLQEGAAGFAE